MQDKKHQEHEFEPFYTENSRILILGSFPSVKSREQKFYYGHPQNRFWKVLSGLQMEPVPKTLEEKKQFLTRHHIALWDVIESCDISGSSDSSITNVVPTNLRLLIEKSEIRFIYTNGALAGKLYRKYQGEQIQLPMISLPSTSPANAAYSLERLLSEWKQTTEC